MVSISFIANSEFPLSFSIFDIASFFLPLVISHVGDSGQKKRTTVTTHGKHNITDTIVLHVNWVDSANVVTIPMLYRVGIKDPVNFRIRGWLISPVYGGMFAKHNPNDIPPSMRDIYNKLTLLANRRNRKPEMEKMFAKIIVLFRPK